MVETFARNGKIISFGCGADDIIFHINPELYTSYVGIDISEVAIEKASLKASKLGLKKCKFSVENMINWPGDEDITLIILQESLCYLDQSQQRKFLTLCFNSLTEEGSVMVTLHSKQKHQKTVNTCKEIGKLVQEITIMDAIYMVLKR